MTSKEALNNLCGKIDKISVLAIKNSLMPFEVAKDIDSIMENMKQIKKDLEVLEIIKETPELVWWVCCYKDAYEMIADRKGFMLDYSMEDIVERFNKIKGWLENEKEN